MKSFLKSNGYPDDDYGSLCLRMVLGRAIPAAAGVLECDQLFVRDLEKAGTYKGFMLLATRLALRDVHIEGQNIWSEYLETDHYAKNYCDWFGNVIPLDNDSVLSYFRRKRLSTLIDPSAGDLETSTKHVLYTMLYIATSVAPGCFHRYKTKEQALLSIVRAIEENLHGHVSQAGMHVAAVWAAEIACAVRGKQGF